jgi:hypothetical protein
MKNSPKSLREDSHDTDGNNLTRAQYYDRKSHTRHLDGESRLLFAVLEDGVRCILLGRWAAPGTEKHRELAETMVWVNIRGDHDLFSFDSICTVFEIEPDTLRRKLNSLHAESQDRRPLKPDQMSDLSVAPRLVQLADCGLRLGHQRESNSRRYADVIPVELEAGDRSCRMRSGCWPPIREFLTYSACGAFRRPKISEMY